MPVLLKRGLFYENVSKAFYKKLSKNLYKSYVKNAGSKLRRFPGQADIRNPLRYLLITECCFAAYQEWLAPLLIRAGPLLIALHN